MDIGREQAAYTAVAWHARSYHVRERLYKKYGSWENVWYTVAQRARPLEHAEQELTKHRIRVVLHDDPLYPPLLRETSFPPHALFVQGTFPGSWRCIAVVGTRKAQDSSRACAEEWAATLAESGVTVVSGMAYGIDAAAHTGALRNTLAVLATGADLCYPEGHRSLRDRILENGCLLTEYPPGMEARPHYFLERNRIIAGLSQATVVIAAPERSGSLATARYAVEAGREVLVAPGAVDDPHFTGSHALIREGATLVRNADDILEAVGVTRTQPDRAKTAAATTPDEATILSVIAENGALTIDKIVELTKLSTHIVSRTLTMLTLRHALKEKSNGRYGAA